MHITALAGGVGGARFLRGLLAALDQDLPLDRPGPDGQPSPHGQDSPAEASARPRLTVIGNTGDDITLHGLRICPDLDTVLYTLGGVVDEDQGWGRAGETHHVQAELAALGLGPDWFTLGDKDFGVHVGRSHLLARGLTLSEITQRLADRFGLTRRGVRLLPMSDTPVETHVVVTGDQGPEAIHFQEWWIRHRAQLAAQRFVLVGLERAQAAPGVVEAIAEADVILLPPSNPVVSLGIILTIPGVREALRETAAPIVGVSPIIAGQPVRGYADICLEAIGVASTAGAVAGLYADFLDGWLVDTADDPAAVTPTDRPIRVERRPLLMSDPDSARDLARAALDLALDIARGSGEAAPR